MKQTQGNKSGDELQIVCTGNDKSHSKKADSCPVLMSCHLTWGLVQDGSQKRILCTLGLKVIIGGGDQLELIFFQKE